MFVRLFGVEIFAGRDYVRRVNARGMDRHECGSLEVYGFGAVLVVSKGARTGR